MTGRIIRDFAPDKLNPRNSEGAFINLKDGSVLFAYTRYSGGDGDDGAPADIYGCISRDDGNSFSEPFIMFDHKTYGAQNLMSVSFLRMNDGSLGIFFLEKSRPYQCIPYFSRSTDEGAVWSKPVRCIDEKGYFVMNNDRVIKLGDGRIMFAVAYTPVTVTEEADGDTFKKGVVADPAEVWVYESDDDGASWKKIAVVPYIYGDKKCFSAGWQEPGLLEMPDGSIKLLIRTDLGRIYESYSRDGGKSWLTPSPSEFTAPISPISAKRLSCGKTVYVWNPVPLWNGKSQLVRGVWTGARTPLAMAAVNIEDGRTPEFREIENDPERGYAYTAIHETPGGEVLLAYCAGGVADGGMLNRLRIKKFSSEEIKNL